MEQNSSEKLFNNRNLHIIFGVTLMAVLGVSSISPAFPKIEKSLNITEEQVGLLITLFTLPGVLLTPVLGVLADRLGRKKILVPSLFLFGIAGGACALTTNFNALLIMRFLQGVGAASLGSLNVTLVGDFFSGKKRAAAMGYNASVLSIGTAAYPAIGGLLATIGWNYPFFLPLAAIPIGLIILFKLNIPEPEQQQKLKEYLSAAVKGMKRSEVVGLFLASVFTFIILYGAFLTYFPILLDRTFDSPPILIGGLMSVMSISTAVTSSQLGRLSKNYSEKHLILAAFLFYAAATMLIPFIKVEWLLIFPLILFGIGQGMNIPGIQNLLSGYAPKEYRAVYMSINGTVLRLGQTIGPLLMGLLFTVWGLSGVYVSAAFIAALMFVLVILLIKNSDSSS